MRNKIFVRRPHHHNHASHSASTSMNQHPAFWPPQKGSSICFKTPHGRKSGVLASVRQGLLWTDYLLEDGRIVPEHDLLECPEPSRWRDPREVSEAEVTEWVARIREKLEAG